MLIASLVAQGEGGSLDLLYWILPVLICLILIRGQPGGETSPKGEILVDSWFTPEGIDEAFSAIIAETDQWRIEEETKSPPSSMITRLINSFTQRGPKERFVLREEVHPRLYRLEDSTGPLIFELTTVEGGGTVVKVWHSYAIKARVARFRASQPAKVPATPIGLHCPSCGKPVLQEYIVCPYCSEKLVKE
jgi:hypothetical protein